MHFGKWTAAGVLALASVGCTETYNQGIGLGQDTLDAYAAKFGRTQELMSFRESLLDAEAKKTGRVVLKQGARVSPYYYEDFAKTRLTNGVVRKRVAIEEDVLVEAEVVAPQVSAAVAAAATNEIVVPIPEVKIETSPNQGVFGEIIRGGK